MSNEEVGIFNALPRRAFAGSHFSAVNDPVSVFVVVENPFGQPRFKAKVAAVHVEQPKAKAHAFLCVSKVQSIELEPTTTKQGLQVLPAGVHQDDFQCRPRRYHCHAVLANSHVVAGFRYQAFPELRNSRIAKPQGVPEEWVAWEMGGFHKSDRGDRFVPIVVGLPIEQVAGSVREDIALRNFAHSEVVLGDPVSFDNAVGTVEASLEHFAAIREVHEPGEPELNN
jgi:hypothetical protein